MRAASMAPLALLRIATLRAAKAFVQHVPRSIGQHFGQALWVPNVTSVQFGDFERIMPISDVDGYDRGKPIDRYYIERALAGHLELVHGRVLEVTGRVYTRLFGAEKVVCSEVLDIDPINTGRDHHWGSWRRRRASRRGFRLHRSNSNLAIYL